MTLDDEDFGPRKYARRLIGGPCDGQLLEIDDRWDVVQAMEPTPLPYRSYHTRQVKVHAYERQTFIHKRMPYRFWFWVEMPAEERLAAVEKMF
jgi:hypothetical protein